MITVIAGVNGAGKSSVAGERIRRAGKDYFNPDEAARRLHDESGLSLDKANALAWQIGKERLEQAIRDRSELTFETTLGGNTITRLL